MSTYNIEYQGITIVEKVKSDNLENMLMQVKGLVILTGKDTEEIKVILNKE
jgi:hypothetical protein